MTSQPRKKFAHSFWHLLWNQVDSWTSGVKHSVQLAGPNLFDVGLYAILEVTSNRVEIRNN